MLKSRLANLRQHHKRLSADIGSEKVHLQTCVTWHSVRVSFQVAGVENDGIKLIHIF
jgi:hypothetical protein